MNRMIRPIVLHPDARLKKKSVEVEGITDALIELAEDMMETMYHAPGIGLAARSEEHTSELQSHS